MRVAFSVSCLVGHIHIHYFNILHDFVMPDFVVALECLYKGRMCSNSGKALEAPSCPEPNLANQNGLLVAAGQVTVLRRCFRWKCREDPHDFLKINT